MKIEVDIPFPEGVLDEHTRGRAQRAALEAAVLRLFDDRRITSAEAAQDLGLTRAQFMEFTRKRGVPHYDYTAEDLAADMADVEEIERRLPPNASR